MNFETVFDVAEVGYKKLAIRGPIESGIHVRVTYTGTTILPDIKEI
jgi:hypothetical protein